MAPGSAARKGLPLVSIDHQQVSKVRPASGRETRPAVPRDDHFAALVRQVSADPANPCNIDRYLWALEVPAPRGCDECGELFDPWFAYDGGPARGLPRRYCSLRCAGRAAEFRRRVRLAGVRVGEWGRAAA